MLLNKDNADKIYAAEHISVPGKYEFELAEKVLQFGTGVLLRGLPDYYICKANRQKVFNGRIIAVKSTEIGDVDAFNKQDNLFIHAFKGFNLNNIEESFFINAAISKVLTAKNQWQKILECAAQPQLQIIISNTTEAGIVLDRTDNIHLNPPQSFPGKLLSFLYKRYKIFKGSMESGMVIIPTELITDNAKKLKNILIELAEINQLKNDFIDWVITANDFCNSLVDRIVTATKKQEIFCDDALSIESEYYGLWAIETSSFNTKQTLSFSLGNKDIIITDDIKKFRELKMALLNATHSFCCALALLYGFKTVDASMSNDFFRDFIKQLMLDEIAPCIINKQISAEDTEAFAETVVSRFSNSYIRHEWSAIAFQYTEKIKERCVPLVMKYCTIFSEAPQKMGLGFAAYILYMKLDPEEIFSDKKYWSEDMNAVNCFKETVILYIDKIEQHADLSSILNDTNKNYAV